MVRNRDPFALALDSLRVRLSAGDYSPGTPIVIFEEAKRLGLSTTPVREALAWLSGAGLVDHAQTGGYLAPRLDVGFLRDGYAFRNICLQISLDKLDLSLAKTTGSDLGAGPFFAWIVARGGNVAVIDAFHRITLQLDRLEHAERRLLSDVDFAVVAMQAAVAGGDLAMLAQQIDAFHRERISAAAALVFEATRAPPDQG